jgi:hypothetical protein
MACLPSWPELYPGTCYLISSTAVTGTTAAAKCASYPVPPPANYTLYWPNSMAENAAVAGVSITTVQCILSAKLLTYTTIFGAVSELEVGANAMKAAWINVQLNASGKWVNGNGDEMTQQPWYAGKHLNSHTILTDRTNTDQANRTTMSTTRCKANHAWKCSEMRRVNGTIVNVPNSVRSCAVRSVCQCAAVQPAGRSSRRIRRTVRMGKCVYVRIVNAVHVQLSHILVLQGVEHSDDME